MASAAKRADRRRRRGRWGDGAGRTRAIVAVGCETEPVSRTTTPRLRRRRCCGTSTNVQGSLQRSRRRARRARRGTGQDVQVVGASASRRATAAPSTVPTCMPGEQGRCDGLSGQAAIAHGTQPHLHLTFAPTTYESRDQVRRSSSTPSVRSFGALSRYKQAGAVREKMMEGMSKALLRESVLSDETWYHADESTRAVGRFLQERDRAARLRLVRRRVDVAASLPQLRHPLFRADPARVVREALMGSPSTGSMQVPSISWRELVEVRGARVRGCARDQRQEPSTAAWQPRPGHGRATGVYIEMLATVLNRFRAGGARAPRADSRVLSAITVPEVAEPYIGAVQCAISRRGAGDLRSRTATVLHDRRRRALRLWKSERSDSDGEERVAGVLDVIHGHRLIRS